jgi:N-acetylglucosamine-6-sulfatase
VQAPGPAGGRSLSRLGRLAFLLFLVAGLAGGIAIRNSAERAERIAQRPAPEEAAAKPNVIVVMTDDQTVAQMSAMPRTRRLIGNAGTSFDRFYVTDPLCCPSRATFFSGRYAHNTGVISNGGPNALPAFDERRTLGVWLQAAGYRTAFVGKYLNGYGLGNDPEHVPPGWSEWHALLEPTTQSYFDYDVNDNGEVRRYGSAPDDYKSRVIGHLAVDAIRHGARANRPLFMYVGFNAPHAPSTPAPRDAGSLAGTEAPRTPAFNEADVSDKPSFLRDRPPLDQAAFNRIDSRNEKALESLKEVDRQVAKIVEALRSQGELGNTYLVFTSDNGYLDGEHRVEYGKLLPYDPSSRVPLLVRGPGVATDTDSQALVGNIDLAPTILALSGASADLDLDGRPLPGLPGGPSKPGHRPLVIESLVRDRSTYYGYPYRAIRTGRWLYVEYSTGDRELYDLESDPDELDSRATDPKYTPTVDYLAKALDRLQDCEGQECRAPVGPVPAPQPKAKR